MTPGTFLRTIRRLGLKRSVAAIFLAIQLAGAIFESIGIGMLLPVFQFVQAGSDAAALAVDSRLWQFLVETYGALGLAVTLPTLLVTSFVFLLLRQAFTYGRSVYTAHVRYALIAEIRSGSFRDYLSARLDYAERGSLGDLVNDLTIEVERATQNIFSMLMLAGYGVLFLVYLGMMMAVSPSMTGAAVGVLVVAVLTLRQVMRQSRQVGVEITDANQALTTFMVERLKTLRLIRLSGSEAGERAEMRRLTRRQRDGFVRANVLVARISVVIEPIVVAAAYVFLWLGSRGFGLSLEEIGLFLVIAIRLTPVAREAMVTRQSFLTSLAGLTTVDRRLREMEERREGAGGARRLESLHSGIRFVGVRFDYDDGTGEVSALNGVDLEIPAAQITALVGPSGSGKSTLIDLLPRLRDPKTGQILFDGTPVDAFSLASLRAAIAYAPQSPQLFNVSVASHIRYGRPKSSDKEVRAAAHLAGADDFIESLPHGYATLVGEGGMHLSGGERQRIDLARVLVRRAPILVLDEPTSNLDADAEVAFREALLRIRAHTDTTMILVGHRLSTVAIADRIAVLQHGRISELGSHSELLGRGGWYADAFAKQCRVQDAQTASVVHG